MDKVLVTGGAHSQLFCSPYAIVALAKNLGKTTLGTASIEPRVIK